jgi:hypothetical protein
LDACDWQGDADALVKLIESAEPYVPSENKPALELRFGHAATIPQSIGTVVRGILHAGSLTLFYGPPKSGKSFLVTDLLLHVALPALDKWMGHAVVRHGPVLYVACEGHSGFWKRLRAVEIDHGIILPDDFVVAYGRPHLIQIDPKSHAAVPHPDDVLDAVRRATEAGHPPIAIAIDTVFRSIGAGNVSASDHMNAYLAALGAITDQGIAMAGVHHETKAGGTPAGSVTLIGGSDTLINTQRLEGGGHCWNVEMAKDDSETEARGFTLEVIDVGDFEGQPQASCVVRDGQKIVKRGKKLNSTQALACSVLTDALDEAGKLTVTFPDGPKVLSISRATARNYLLRSGFFHEGTLDKDGKVLRAGFGKEWNVLRDLKAKGIFGFNRDWIWKL